MNGHAAPDYTPPSRDGRPPIRLLAMKSNDVTVTSLEAGARWREVPEGRRWICCIQSTTEHLRIKSPQANACSKNYRRKWCRAQQTSHNGPFQGAATWGFNSMMAVYGRFCPLHYSMVEMINRKVQRNTSAKHVQEPNRLRNCGQIKGARFV